MTEIEINGEKYIKKSSINTLEKTKELNGLEYAIVRTYSAGVFAGFIKKENDKTQTVELLNARRLWFWSGAASLSQLSQEGVKFPTECKFPCEVPSVRLKQVIEILPCTQKAKDSIAGVSIWSA